MSLLLIAFADEMEAGDGARRRVVVACHRELHGGLGGDAAPQEGGLRANGD